MQFGFIPDSNSVITEPNTLRKIEKRNLELSACLAQSPWKDREIQTIQRNDPADGWDLTYK
jgi:hypothetical protein